MEDLSKILTELAENKLVNYKDNELTQIVQVCDSLKTIDECMAVYRISFRGLTSACIAFIEGLEFTGTAIDTNYLTEKSWDIISGFQKEFFDYMEQVRKAI